MKTNCAQFSVPGNSTITGIVNCNVSGTPYTLADADGRSNAIEITSIGSKPCAGKTVNEECLGGIIFQTNGTTGLIVAKTDSPTTLPWQPPAGPGVPAGCRDTNLGTSLVDPYAGASNTTLIVNACGNTSDYAAGYCRNTLGSAWYLPANPSTDPVPNPNSNPNGGELNDLWRAANSGSIPAAGITTGPGAYFYWSSTLTLLVPAFIARAQNFFDGGQGVGTKDATNGVRCIQAY